MGAVEVTALRQAAQRAYELLQTMPVKHPQQAREREEVIAALREALAELDAWEKEP